MRIYILSFTIIGLNFLLVQSIMSQNINFSLLEGDVEIVEGQIENLDSIVNFQKEELKRINNQNFRAIDHNKIIKHNNSGIEIIKKIITEIDASTFHSLCERHFASKSQYKKNIDRKTKISLKTFNIQNCILNITRNIDTCLRIAKPIFKDQNISHYRIIDNEYESLKASLKLINKDCILIFNLFEMTKATFNEGLKTGSRLYIDQDFFMPPKNEDRDYTMGFAYSWSGRRVWECRDGFNYLNLPLHALRLFDIPLDILLKKKNWCNVNEISHSSTIGISAFTPDSLNTSDPLTDDRPYSSLLYWSVSKRRLDNTKNIFLQTEFSLGVLGLPLADWGQSGIHHVYRELANDTVPYKPLGWHNQISHEGMLTALYKLKVAKEWTKISKCHDKIDLSYGAEVSVGYYTNLALSTTLRFGNLNSPWHAFNSNPMANGNQKRNKSKGDLFLFFTPRFRVIGYNTLLQGQLLYDTDNPTHIPAEDISRLIFEFEAGFVISTWGRTDIMFTISNRTKSFEYEGVASHSHWWGGLYLIFNPRF